MFSSPVLKSVTWQACRAGGRAEAGVPASARGVTLGVVGAPSGGLAQARQQAGAGAWARGRVRRTGGWGAILM